MRGGQDFLVSPPRQPQPLDGFRVGALRVAGDLNGVVEQRARLAVQWSLAVVALDLRGQLRIVGDGTEILPVGFGSIKAVQLTRRRRGQHLPHRTL
jgi:hypothetical protein